MLSIHLVVGHALCCLAIPQSRGRFAQRLGAALLSPAAAFQPLLRLLGQGRLQLAIAQPALLRLRLVALSLPAALQLLPALRLLFRALTLRTRSSRQPPSAPPSARGAQNGRPGRHVRAAPLPPCLPPSLSHLRLPPAASAERLGGRRRLRLPGAGGRTGGGHGCGALPAQLGSGSGSSRAAPGSAPRPGEQEGRRPAPGQRRRRRYQQQRARPGRGRPAQLPPPAAARSRRPGGCGEAEAGSAAPHAAHAAPQPGAARPFRPRRPPGRPAAPQQAQRASRRSPFYLKTDRHGQFVK